MPTKMKPTSTIIANLGLENGGRVHAFFTSTCAKAMDRYVPFREGTLAETVILGGQITNNVTTDTITYETPYARYVYYGISKSGKPLKYNTEKHKDAGAYWDKVMWSVKGEEIVQRVQNYVKRGGYNE